MKSRALRRHHEQRMKSRVCAYYGGYARGNPRAVGKLAHTRTPCSCVMCGNPRRRFAEPSLQERREGAWMGSHRQSCILTIAAAVERGLESLGCTPGELLPGSAGEPHIRSTARS